MGDSAVKMRSVFYHQGFRDDLGMLVDISDDAMDKISTWFADVGSSLDLTADEAWVTLSVRSGLPVDKARTVLNPVLYVAQTAAENQVTVSNLVEKMVSEGLLEKDGKVAERLEMLGEPLAMMLATQMAEVAPAVPLPYVAGTTSRCVLVSEFDKEFGIGDTLETYTPRLHKLHPRLTLSLTFTGEDQAPVGFMLSPENLKELISHLLLSQKQLNVLVDNDGARRDKRGNGSRES
jgi:hypothetical protein